MTLTEEEFEQMYRKMYKPGERAVKDDNWIHGRIIVHPNLFPMDPKIRPQR